ncbi:hypothetical protein [Kiloniella majae]|uniref:hypothetical protein n=1 Tax=Kiloniella majae TaxID=1938558 RepID=UPI000A277856|nr:hypothetical protein [Kiloniella majae]
MLYHSPDLNARSIPEILITADGYNVDLSQLALENGWKGTGAFSMRVIVEQGVKIGSTSTSIFSMITGSLPPESKIQLINNGIIAGAGGRGGKGGDGWHDNASAGRPGSVGGPALQVNCTFVLDNTNGIIGGGGGGGGGGMNQNPGSNGAGIAGTGGGGGAGFDAGLYGPFGSGGNPTTGSSGTLLVGGAGQRLRWGDDGVTGDGLNGAPAARYSGKGGDLGQVGGSAYSYGGAAGGFAGNAIDGVSKVTFVARGDIRGPEVN